MTSAPTPPTLAQPAGGPQTEGVAPPVAVSPTPAEPAAAAVEDKARGAAPLPSVLHWLTLALAVAGLVIGVMAWQKLSGMQEQLARQSAEASARAVEARTLAAKAEETASANADRVRQIDARTTDLAAYRTQLEDLVQHVARARDENLSVDLESALRVAQDQMLLTGSVEPVVAALRTAERRIARSADPRLAPVGRAVARDLERVKKAALPDTAGLLARLDQLVRQVDDLPVANEVAAQRRDDTPARVDPAAGRSWWERSAQAVREEVTGLLRVTRVERPEAMLMSPDQAFFVRENLKLRLLHARMALLARQFEAARADLSAASLALGRYFDPASRRTQAAATALQQVQEQTRSADLPRVDDTLSALTVVNAPGR